MSRERKHNYSNKAPSRRESEDLESYYKRIAATANKRLQRAEKYAENPSDMFSGMTKYAYASAMKDIQKLRGEDRTRFDRTAPKSKQKLKSEIEAIEKFLASPTSTKRGVTEVYKKRADTLNKNMGLTGSDKLTWEDMYSYWEKEAAGKFTYNAAEFKSMIALRNAQREAGKSLIEDIKNASASNVHVTGDKILDMKIKKMVDEGLKPSDYFPQINFK